jgi:hypothetical protein
MSIPEFITPSNQLSFSSAIDAAVQSTGDAALIPFLISAANDVIRNAQATLKTPLEDIAEVELTADATGALSWPLPKLLRRILTVRYVQHDTTAEYIPPGSAEWKTPCKYYTAGGTVFFGGLYPNEVVQIAYLTLSYPFTYYARPEVLSSFMVRGVVDSSTLGRPAYYDTMADCWMYLQSDGETYATSLPAEEAMASARKRSANWVVISWFNLLVSGIVSAAMTRRGDTNMSAPAYSQYRAQLTMLKQLETAAGGLR